MINKINVNEAIIKRNKLINENNVHEAIIKGNKERGFKIMYVT